MGHNDSLRRMRGGVDTVIRMVVSRVFQTLLRYCAEFACDPFVHAAVDRVDGNGCDRHER